MQHVEWVIWLIRVFLALGSLGVFIFLCRWIMGRFGKWHELWSAMTGALKRQSRVFVIVSAMCFLITVMLPLASLDENLTSAITRYVGVAWVVLGAWAVSLGLSIVFNAIQWRYDIDVSDNLLARRVHTRIRVMQRVLVVLIWSAAFAGVLMQFDSFRALGTTLLASAGVLSIVLGISAQKLSVQ